MRHTPPVSPVSVAPTRDTSRHLQWSPSPRMRLSGLAHRRSHLEAMSTPPIPCDRAPLLEGDPSVRTCPGATSEASTPLSPRPSREGCFLFRLRIPQGHEHSRLSREGSPPDPPVSRTTSDGGYRSKYGSVRSVTRMPKGPTPRGMTAYRSHPPRWRQLAPISDQSGRDGCALRRWAVPWAQ
jgi:hypothetical protein